MAPSRHADEGGKLQQELTEASRVEEEEEDIDKLISQGINAGDVKKLQDAGIYTCNGLMKHTKKSLKEITGLSESKVDKICEAAEKLLKFESQAPDKPMIGASLEAVEGFLLKHFPDPETFMKKNYELKPKQITETIEKRLEGYQKICMYGLGFVFWGAASGILEKLDTNLVHWFAIYFTVSLVLMLGGLLATMLPSSTPLALGTASLGAWTAYVYILATFHIASLKFHQHVCHCLWFMIISTIVLTLHWGSSAQEPLIALRCVLFVLWVIVICLKQVINFFAMVQKENPPLMEHLLRSNRGNNMQTCAQVQDWSS